MNRDAVTSQDVARLAGVSQSAVSRVFTPGASVSSAMRERVMSAAETLGYRPNALARSLITGQSRMIGLVLAYLENQYYPVALEKLSRALQLKGYHVVVFFASNASDNIDPVLEEILDYQIDGLILASTSLSNGLAERCHEAGIPVVLFNRRQNNPSLSHITSDNYAGGKRLAEFLIQGNHQRIAHVAGWAGAATQIDREAGFVAGLTEAGLTLFARESGDYDFETTREATRRLFPPGAPLDTLPDAVFVANDHMAFAVLETLRHELSIAVPEQVSVVAYDDVPLASWPSYNLTTLRQPTNRMVSATVDVLLGSINKPIHEPQHIEIEGPLIVRGSARLPPVSS